MEQKKRATELRLALSLQGISVPHSIAEQIVETMDRLAEVGEDFTVRDAVKLQFKYDEIRAKEKEEKP